MLNTTLMGRTTAARLKPIFILILVLAIGVAACGGDDSGDAAATTSAAFDVGEDNDRSPEAPASDPQGEPTDGGDRAAVDADVLGSGGVEPVTIQPTTFGREIIYTASLTVAVTDVATAGTEATRIIEGLGGILFGQQTQGQPEPYSVLVFKVLPEDFQAALAALGSIGEVRTQNVSADDVTERIVDLESRITTAEASVDRLRGFLENATDISDIAELEAQLLERETNLETLRGQLRTLRDRVDLATITLTLTEALADPRVRLIASAYPGDDDGVLCPGAESLIVTKGEAVVLCFEIRNSGDTVLTDFTLVDTVLELELDDLDVIAGDPASPLQPGQSIILATGLEPDRRILTRTTVTAVPVNEDGTPIEAREVADIGSVNLRVEEPEGLPGFDDGLRVATDVLKWMGGVIVIGAGLAVPFLWLIPLIGLIWWWRRRRSSVEPTEVIATADTAADDANVPTSAEPAEGSQ